MIKLKLVPLVGTQMTKTYIWTRPTVSSLHPDKMCQTPNSRSAPSTVNLVTEPDPKLHHILLNSVYAIFSA